MGTGFNGTRLEVARSRQGLLKKELAIRCGVSVQTVSNWERGMTQPSDDDTARLAAETGYEPDWFFKGDIEIPPEGAVTFRARTRLSARKKHSARAAAAMAAELADWLESRYELPAVDLPDLTSHPHDPSLVARVVRQDWALGDKPIPNMIHLLESRGVLVFSLAQDVRELDAFSFWHNGRPIVLLNTMKSAERSRMDAAHELLHLACHRDKTDKKEEAEADSFAGTFLMPKVDVFLHIPRFVSVNHLIELKHRWRVALVALVYRLHKLGILSRWQYRTLFVQMSSLGYRTSEPNPIEQREASQVLAKVFSTSSPGGVTRRVVTQALKWKGPQLDEKIFGLGATLLPVARQGGPPTATRGHEFR